MDPRMRGLVSLVPMTELSHVGQIRSSVDS